MQLNKMIDHTKLGTQVSKTQVDQLIEEARNYDFKSVCVTPIWVRYAKEALNGSKVLVCTVIGFPHGTHKPSVKAYEAEEAIKDGADELDMVINVHAVKTRDRKTLLDEIQGVKKAARSKVVKVIIETCYLTPEDIVFASRIVEEAGADFVKTSTGFGTYGARLEDVRLMKQSVKKIEVKASGGVRSFEDATAMIEAGATRIGTSNGIDIIKQRRKEDDSNPSY